MMRIIEERNYRLFLDGRNLTFPTKEKAESAAYDAFGEMITKIVQKALVLSPEGQLKLVSVLWKDREKIRSMMDLTYVDFEADE